MNLLINFKVDEIEKRWNVLRAQLMLTCKKTSESISNLINSPLNLKKKKCWIFSFLIRSDNVTVLVKEASPKPSIIVNKRRHAKRFGYFDEVNKKR